MYINLAKPSTSNLVNWIVQFQLHGVDNTLYLYPFKMLSFRAGIVAKQVKLLSATPAIRMSTSLSSACSTCDPALC